MDSSTALRDPVARLAPIGGAPEALPPQQAAAAMSG